MAAPLVLSTIISALVVVASSTRGTMANGVFQVRRKFHIVDGVYKGSDIGALQIHDGNRHRRHNLMASELPLGGFSIPYGTGYALIISAFGHVCVCLVGWCGY
ncbi:hypothetical protein EE612_023041 [Oryza sativa]|nr:hypothetical protein EE612_023041 [Oryza sativa]